MKLLRLPLATSLAVFSLLAIVQIMPKKPILLLDRVYSGAGWFQILLFCGYASLIAWHMQDVSKSALWRRRTWFLFSIVFFGQLILGLVVSSFFLMTGRLHLPIPAMIIAGPLYRGEIGMMPMLLLSTVLLSGPAWCSHICYFGGLDNIAATSSRCRIKVVPNTVLKLSILIVMIFSSLVLRFTNAHIHLVVGLAAVYGLIGCAVILLYSLKRGSMLHCTIYCPIGTLVRYLKWISPFRLRIEQNCSACNRCTSYCSYGALERAHLLAQRPGPNCTLCGDCLAACSNQSLKYSFMNLTPEHARMLWLFITITLHTVTLAIARI